MKHQRIVLRRSLQLAILFSATIFFSGCVLALGNKGGLGDKEDAHSRFNQIDSQLSTINVRLATIEGKVEQNRPEAHREMEYQLDNLRKEVERLERENADLKDRSARLENKLLDKLDTP